MFESLYEASHTLETCTLNERVESSVTPKVEVLLDGLTTDPQILMLGIREK
jgi:hypothetical protein